MMRPGSLIVSEVTVAATSSVSALTNLMLPMPDPSALRLRIFLARDVDRVARRHEAVRASGSRVGHQADARAARIVEGNDGSAVLQGKLLHLHIFAAFVSLSEPPCAVKS